MYTTTNIYAKDYIVLSTCCKGRYSFVLGIELRVEKVFNCNNISGLHRRKFENEKNHRTTRNLKEWIYRHRQTDQNICAHK